MLEKGEKYLRGQKSEINKFWRFIQFLTPFFLRKDHYDDVLLYYYFSITSFKDFKTKG